MFVGAVGRSNVGRGDQLGCGSGVDSVAVSESGCNAVGKPVSVASVSQAVAIRRRHGVSGGDSLDSRCGVGDGRCIGKGRRYLGVCQHGGHGVHRLCGIRRGYRSHEWTCRVAVRQEWPGGVAVGGTGNNAAVGDVGEGKEDQALQLRGKNTKQGLLQNQWAELHYSELCGLL